MNWTASRQVTRDPLRRQATRTVPGNFSTTMCRVLRATQIPFTGSKYPVHEQGGQQADTPGRGAPTPRQQGTPNATTPSAVKPSTTSPLARLTVPTVYHIARYVVQLGNACQSVSSPHRRGSGSRIFRAKTKTTLQDIWSQTGLLLRPMSQTTSLTWI